MNLRPLSPEEITALSTDSFDLLPDYRQVIEVFVGQLRLRPPSELQVRLGVEPQLLKTVHPRSVPEYSSLRLPRPTDN